MSKEHKHDISIGEDQWIIFGDLKNGQNEAFNVDSLMEALIPMWKSLETQCVAECCGIDAYDLWEEDVLKNTENFNHQALIEELVKFRNEIASLEQEVLVSKVLNNFFTKETFIKVLEHLLTIYKRI